MAIDGYRIHPESEKTSKGKRASKFGSIFGFDDSLKSTGLSTRPSSKLYHHGRVVLGATALLVMLSLTVGASMLEAHNSIKASRSAFLVLDKSLQFSQDYSQVSTVFQIRAFMLGYSAYTSLLQSLMQDDINKKIHLFQELKTRYQHHKKKAPQLKMANDKFNELTESFDALMQSNFELIDYFTNLSTDTSLLTFDHYLAVLEETKEQNLGLAQMKAFQMKMSLFTHELRKISLQSQTNTRYITIAVQFILFFVLLGFAFSLHKHFKESNIKLAAQDKLLRQQMHEARNKFCPAMYMMEQFLENAHKQDITVQDFTSLADDMHMALVALKEVEAQHQARLDMYKILKGNYVINKETFDILELMRERSAVERTVALARARATNSPIAQFVSAIEDKNCPQHNSSQALFIQTDLYILSHVIANLLSNARKFCSSGQIKVSFNGTSTNSDDLLIFSVRDSGSGLPEALKKDTAKLLFGAGAISGDTRGSGLGLPSCHLFCKAGGGYIKLSGSKQVDEHSNGYTEFEFALKGKIIRADMRRASLASSEETESVTTQDSTSSMDKMNANHQSTLMSTSPSSSEELPNPSPRLAPPSIPDDVQIVAIDDSALNRTCVIRTFKKIERASHARGFKYLQFETIESSMPYFRELQDTSKVIVMLDENLESRGGVLHGIQGTRWLLHELKFSGIIISTSGDPDVGRMHLEEGPKVINWGKPLPNFDKMLADVTQALAPTMHNISSAFAS